MRSAGALLQAYEDAAWDIAQAPFDATSWDQERRAAVVTMLEIGNRIVGRLGGAASSKPGSIRWSTTDPPVLLARAFGRMHRRLSAAVDRAGPGADHAILAAEIPDLQSGLERATAQQPRAAHRRRRCPMFEQAGHLGSEVYEVPVEVR